MSIHNPLQPPEGASTRENAGYRWAFLLVIYALLIDVIYRAGVRHEAPWDLLALVVIGGGACEAYQIHQKSPTQGWAVKAVLLACVTGIVAALLALVLPRWMH